MNISTCYIYRIEYWSYTMCVILFIHYRYYIRKTRGESYHIMILHNIMIEQNLTKNMKLNILDDP